MIIIITVLFLFLLAAALVILHWFRPNFRLNYLIAVTGALAAWGSVLFWRFRQPLTFQLPRWEPASLFLESLSFTSDTLTWPFAFSLMTLTLAVILTAVARENFPNPLPWAATLVLGGLGLLAVLADNPLSLLMVWAAIDLAELAAQLRSVDGPQPSERVVTAFAARVAGAWMLLWANMVSVSSGTTMNFRDAPPQTGLYLLIASGLRLGVLPLHLPYASESAIRRGFGTALRLVSAASSIVLLVRIPFTSIQSPYTPYLLILATLAALYGGWMWMRAPDELNARPFWMISVAGLATASALRANPVGAAAWGIALIVSGGALFLTSVYQIRLNRILLLGVLGISSLPFSLTSTGWQSNVSAFWPAWPFLILTQAFLLTGYIRHALRPTHRINFDSLDRAGKIIFPIGIGALLMIQIALGILGWDGALQIGAWLPTSFGVIAGAALVWLRPRLPLLTPIRAHWIRPMTTSWTDWLFKLLWGIYRLLGRLSNAISSTLEGDGGIMWTLLFLVLFVSLLIQRTPGP